MPEAYESKDTSMDHSNVRTQGKQHSNMLGSNCVELVQHNESYLIGYDLVFSGIEKYRLPPSDFFFLRVQGFDRRPSPLFTMSSLIVIDLQEDFLSPERIPPKPFIDSLPRVLRQFTIRRRPIIWIDSLYESKAETPPEAKDITLSANELYLSGTHRSGRFCVPNTPGIRIHHDLLPLIQPHHTRITKRHYSAFKETTLHAALQEAGTKHVFLAGVTTNTCVSATAVDARRLGYDVTIIEDCAKAFKQSLHDRAIHTLTQDYNAKLCTSNDISAHFTDAEALPTLYYVNGSIPSWRVMLFLAWRQIPYNAIRLRVMSKPKETRSAEFAAISPRCKTPTLVDSDGTVVIESLAILQYLEPFNPSASHQVSKAEWTKTLVRFHESENPHNLYEPIELLYDPEWRKHQETILQAYRDIFEELEHWERYLSDADFLSGDDAFGLADCAFYPILAYMVHRGLEFGTKYPGLRRYFDRCGEMQAVREACPDHWEKLGKSLFRRCEMLLQE